MSAPANGNKSPFLPNTRFFPLEPALLQRELNNTYIDLASAINAKSGGVFTTTATPTGQQYFSNESDKSFRAVLRQVFQIDSILNGTTTLAHGIAVSAETRFTRIEGVAFIAGSSYLPIPYLNVLAPADSIGLGVTTTNIELYATTANYTGYSATIVLEWTP